MSNLMKRMFIILTVLLGFSLFVKAERAIAQTCVGSIYCCAPVVGGGCDCGVRSGAGGCGGPTSESACYSREDSLIGSCEGDCYDGACGWNPGSGGGSTPTPTGSGNSYCNTTGDHLGSSGSVSSSNCKAYGWAKDPNALGTPRPIRIDAGGIYINTTAGNMTYGDGGTPGCGAGNDPCGFEVSLSGVIPNNTNVSVRVYAIDKDTDCGWRTLSNSPKTINCSSPPANNPPTCAVAGPSQLVVGGAAGSYAFQGNDNDGDLIRVQGFWADTSASFPQIANASFSPRYNQSVVGSFSCPRAGTIYVGCNAWDQSGLKCSANPYCEWSPPPTAYTCTGWSDCGGSDLVAVNCVTPTPSCPAIGSIVLTPSSASINTGSSTGFTATPRDTGGNVMSQSCVSSVSFSSSAGASVSPTSDTTSPYTTTATCLSDGSRTITAVGRDTYGTTRSDTSTLTCSTPVGPPSTPTLNPPSPSCSGGAPRISLSWSASSGASNYRVYRCTGSSCIPSTQIAQVTSTSYTDTNVALSTTYRYNVRAYNGQFSGYSNIVTATTPASCAVVSPPPPCSCTANLIPSSWSGTTGSSVGFSNSVTNITAGCSVSNVSFVSSNTSVMTMNPGSDSSSPYTSTGNAVGAGSATISSRATLNDGNSCVDSSAVSVGNPVTVSCTLGASPSSGTAPLSSTLTGNVGGTATGDIRYRYDCNGDGSYEHDFTTLTNPTSRPCSYSSAGSYTARLRVDRQGVNATCSRSISVAAAPTCNISVSASPSTIDINKTSSITASATSNYSIDRVEFVSSNTGAVTVSPSSDSSATYTTTATGQDVGSSTITARCIVGGSVLDTATTTVSVRPPSCTVNLSPSSPADSGIGKTTPFSASVSNTNGLPVQRVDFSSTNTGVATVSPSSDSTAAYTTTATGVGPGTTTIRARAYIYGYECDADTSQLTIATPSCSTFNLTMSPPEVELGTSRTAYASVVVSPNPPYSNSDITSVNFASSNPTVATVNPASDTDPTNPAGGYQTSVTGTGVGNTTITGNVIMYGASRCTDTLSVDVLNPEPWWQVKEGDAVAATGSIATDIPYTCVTDLACEEAFMINDTGEDPGVPVYAGSISLGDPAAYISSTNWKGNSTYLGQTVYDYNFFENKLPNSPSPQAISNTSISGGTFSSGGATYNGYQLYRYDGASFGGTTLTVTDAVNITGGRRVVLLVKSAGVRFNGNVNVDDGTDFFMVIAQGDITIDSGVGGSAGAPHIEGLFFAQGRFVTESAGDDADIELRIRGSIIGMTGDGIDLNRDLDPTNPVNNTNAPAEIIEYAPDQTLMYPPFLGAKNIRWREVAP